MLECAVPLGILLPQRQTQLSRGRIDAIGLLAGLGFAGRLGALCAGHDDHQVLRIRLRQLANLRHRVRERLLQSLDVLEDFGLFALAEHRLDLVALLARELADLGNHNRDYRQLGIHVQRLQIFRRERLSHLNHRRQPQVRLVDAVLPDRLVIRHLRKWCLQIHVDGRERRLQESLDHAEDHLRPREADLQIDLRELRLAVGAQVFIPEAAHDLEVAVEAGDHQDLLEYLRRLRQRIELARVHPAGDEVIARAFGRRAGHERRFDFVEALRVQILADGDRDPVSQLDVVLHLRTPEVDVAMLQAHLFIRQHRVGRRKRQRLAVVQDAQLVGHNFDLAGGNVLVDRARIAQLYMPDDRHHELRAHRRGPVVNLRSGVAGDDRLRNAAAVAHIEKNQVAQVAPLVHPSHQHNFRACVGGTQLAAHVSPLQVR